MAKREKKDKKQKSWLRRILKWTGIGLLLVLIALILIPVLFKDQLKELVITEINKELNAELSLGDFDLTFIRGVPDYIDPAKRGEPHPIFEIKDLQYAGVDGSICKAELIAIRPGHVDKKYFYGIKIRVRNP